MVLLECPVAMAESTTPALLQSADVRPNYLYARISRMRPKLNEPPSSQIIQYPGNGAVRLLGNATDPFDAGGLVIGRCCGSGAENNCFANRAKPVRAKSDHGMMKAFERFIVQAWTQGN